MQRHFRKYICIQVKHESHSSLVPKPTRDSKCNFLLVPFSLLGLLVELLRSLLVLYHRSKDIWTLLFRLKLSFRFRLFRFVTHGNMKELWQLIGSFWTTKDLLYRRYPESGQFSCCSITHKSININYDVDRTSLEYHSLLFSALPGFYAPEEACCLCLASIISKAAQTVDFVEHWRIAIHYPSVA